MPTRTSKIPATLTYHIDTSHHSTVNFAGTLKLRIAVHSMIHCKAFGDIVPQSSKKTFIEYRSFHKVNKSALVKDLSSLLWSLLYINDNVYDRVHTFNSLLAQVWNMHAPVKHKQNRSNMHP